MEGMEDQTINHAAVGIGVGCRRGDWFWAPLGQGLSPCTPRATPRAAVKLGRSKMATARWRLLLLTSYPEAGSGDLRRKSYFENAISAVHIGIGDTVHIGTLIGVRSDVNGMASPTELKREGNVRKIYLGR
jgi:hypothetical protein